MPESELAVLAIQRLSRRIPDKRTSKREVADWRGHQNKQHAKAIEKLQLKALESTSRGSTPDSYDSTDWQGPQQRVGGDLAGFRLALALVHRRARWLKDMNFDALRVKISGEPVAAIPASQMTITRSTAPPFAIARRR